MIKTIELTNFKCFRSLELPLGAITMLTGLNGVGKTTIQQALLLLRQSHQQKQLAAHRLALNGELVQIGTAKDALFSDAEDDILGLGIDLDEMPPLRWKFRYDSSADVLVAFDAPSNLERDIDHLGLFSAASFQYLCAERIGPRVSFPMADHRVRVLRQLGERGEFASHFLSSFGRDTVADILLHPEHQELRTLLAQVEAWLSEISPGSRLRLTAHPSLDIVQLGFEFVVGQGLSPTFRPTNVGFGLTYVLSVLISALAAPPGALILIENPEAHLHPRGQLRMGELLVRCAASGVQVLLETHSDHILNGIRLAVHDGLIPPERVAIHYFERGSLGSVVHSPRIDADGRIDQWPPGFFDEWDTALDRLLSPRKRL